MNKELRKKLIDKLESLSLIREQIIKRFTRAPGWSKARKNYLKLHPKCELCGGTKGLEVHHVIPFKESPDLELDPNNFQTLCRPKRCHIFFGHLGSWRKFNPTVKEDVIAWRAKIKHARIIDGDLQT